MRAGWTGRSWGLPRWGEAVAWEAASGQPDPGHPVKGQGSMVKKSHISTASQKAWSSISNLKRKHQSFHPFKKKSIVFTHSLFVRISQIFRLLAYYKVQSLANILTEGNKSQILICLTELVHNDIYHSISFQIGHPCVIQFFDTIDTRKHLNSVAWFC